MTIPRTRTDRIVHTLCPLCGEPIEVHGQVDAEYVETLPWDGQSWLHEQHTTAETRTRTRRLTA